MKLKDKIYTVGGDAVNVDEYVMSLPNLPKNKNRAFVVLVDYGKLGAGLYLFSDGQLKKKMYHPYYDELEKKYYEVIQDLKRIDRNYKRGVELAKIQDEQIKPTKIIDLLE